jgi:hypothetical protein
LHLLRPTRGVVAVAVASAVVVASAAVVASAVVASAEPASAALVSAAWVAVLAAVSPGAGAVGAWVRRQSASASAWVMARTTRRPTTVTRIPATAVTDTDTDIDGVVAHAGLNARRRVQFAMITRAPDATRWYRSTASAGTSLMHTLATVRPMALGACMKARR